MKRITLTITIVMLAVLKGSAQQVTQVMTAWPDFRPAVVHLTDGSKLSLPLANIFLKNSSLLYMSGEDTKEANTKTILSVEFKDRTYYRIDTLLAYPVDSVGENVLFCAKVLDLKAYKQMVTNSATITTLDVANTISYAKIDVYDDIRFPVIPIYYFKLADADKTVLVHERHLKRALSKEKRRMMSSAMNLPGFSWTDEKSLMRLLDMIK